MRVYLPAIRASAGSGQKRSRIEVDINGGLRCFFGNCDYTGVDLEKGRGVDRVSPGQLIDIPTATMDVVVSAECFEHNPFWVETMANMLRISSRKAVVMVSCATTGRKEHGTLRSSPQDAPFSSARYADYYKNLTFEDFERSLNLPGWFFSYAFFVNPVSCDLYFIGFRDLVRVDHEIFSLISKKIKGFGAYQNRLFVAEYR